jgi:hypothetical protein
VKNDPNSRYVGKTAEPVSCIFVTNRWSEETGNIILNVIKIADDNLISFVERVITRHRRLHNANFGRPLVSGMLRGKHIRQAICTHKQLRQLRPPE